MTRKPRIEYEFLMQQAVFIWARMPMNVKKYPGLDLLEGTLNGVRLTASQAGKAKAAGMLKGVHDVRLPVARGSFIGLSVELKCGKNKPTKEQLDYGEALKREGWKVLYVWDDWISVKNELVAYLTQLDWLDEAGLCRACGGSKSVPSVTIAKQG